MKVDIYVESELEGDISESRYFTSLHKGSGKLNDTMANVSIFRGNFFHFVKNKKYAFQMMVNNF